MSPEDVEWFNHFAHPEKWGDNCVLWDGAFWREYGGTENQNHGMFVWGDDDNVRVMPAHRLAYLLYRGELGDLLALHKCPGRTNKHLGRCVNPWHIRPGSRRENYLDAYRDGSVHRQRLSYEDTVQCFKERRSLSRAERAEKYGVCVRWICRLDNGCACAFITEQFVNVADVD